MSDSLKTEPKYLRLNPTKGEAAPRVDRKGGYRKAGIIRGVSVITRGEALGHGFWIDGQMLEQTADAINMRNKGAKARFTHPSLSGDGLGKFLGRVMDAELEGDKVLADLHFSEAAHKTPDGNLAEYLMDMAESSPEDFGLSIAFMQDIEATETYTEEFTEDGVFVSPDELNTENLKHARLAELRAVDAVDEPAANPDGLFHKEQHIAQEADAMASYALGLSDEKPELVSLGLDAERVRQFVGRFLANNNLTLKGEEMSEEKEIENTTEELGTITEPAQSDLDTTPEGEQAESGEFNIGKEPTEEPIQEVETLSEGQKFLSAFGNQGGVWFAEGRSFEECQGLFVESLQAENKQLQEKVKALSQGEAEPVDFTAESKDEVNKTPGGWGSAIRMPVTK